ncbi:MAG: hypothetical protein WCG21_00290 [Eubacteriales bacterium]
MKKFVKVLSVAVIVGLLFTLGGCGSIAKKITDEAKTKISEQLDETTDENSDNTEDTQADADNTDSTKKDSTAITTSEGKGMDWPTKNMGDITPVTCKITAVFTDGSSGSVTFEGMKPGEADDYLAEFDSKGFTNGMITKDSDGIFFIKTNEAGDSIWFSYAPDGTGLITYTPAATK